MNIEKVSTEGFEMRFFRFGSGSKTMVILPGLSIQSVMLSAEAIAAEYAEMAQAFTIFVFDRREKLPARYSIEDMARDTAQAFAALGLKDIYLFGASQGGMLAMLIAAEQPQLIKKLALGSTAAAIKEERDAVLEEWISLAKAHRGEELCLAFGKAVYPKEVFENYCEALRAAGKSITGDEFERFTILAGGTEGFDILNRLCEIQCPVFVIGDKTDAVLGAEASLEIADRLESKPGFRFHMYDGFGHGAYDLAPDYRQRLLDFFLN